MKTIRITLDEKLLRRLDSDHETKRDGRSAVIRRALAEYLNHRRRKAIASSYHQAYSENAGLGREFEGWEYAGRWPRK